MTERNVDPFIDEIAAELRRPVRLDARFDDRVMAAIEQPDVIPLRPSMMPRPWFGRRWTISVTPVGAMAAAASLVGLLALGIWRVRDAAPQLAADSASGPVLTPVADNGLQYHQFLIVAPNARSIMLEGDFNDWDGSKTELTRSSDGVWSASVLLRPGQYQYQFVIDDTLRVADDKAPRVPDGLGGENSVVTISPRAR
ncbi:MAG TPA: glycogen-binding domain-containing protein [Gemmatimonadaceae bacterium]|nr:glycogen-binding domain-containing protein [Gemmatimonadaceae bacterium]